MTITVITLIGLLNSNSKQESIPVIETIEKPIVDKSKDIEIKNLSKELKNKEEKIAKLHANLEALKNAPKVESVEEEVTEKSKNPVLSLLQGLSKTNDNEDVKNRVRNFRKRFYSDLFKQYDLSEDEQNQLIDLVMERDKQKQELFMKLLKEKGQAGLKPENLKELASAELDNDLKGFLGEDYDSFSKYEKSAGERRQIKDLNTSLGEENALDDNQQDQLTDLLMKRTQDKRSGNDMNDEEYLTQASEFMEPTQVKELEKSLKRNNNNQANLLRNLGGGGSSFQIITP